jgi:hypothetical protein
MNNTLEIKDITKYALKGKITRGELLRLFKALDPQHDSPEAGGGSGKIPPSGPGKISRITRQSRITRDLLRRHFVLRIAQCCGDVA